MKFDTIITGGGLAGLTAGIALASKLQRVAVVSKGYSALHFNSGSFGLLGYDADHNELTSPLSGLNALTPEHPYMHIGTSLPEIEQSARRLLADAGLKFTGDLSANHHRLSPLGIARPAWLTLDGMAVIEQFKAQGVRRIVVVGIAGYLDFSPRFYSAGLKTEGFDPQVATVDTDALRRLRHNNTEMRAANIARSLALADIDALADAINKIADVDKADAIIMPAVVGLCSPGDWQRLRDLTVKPLFYAATLGASVPGMLIWRKLAERFVELGGIIIKADAEFADDCKADNYIYAAGRYFSHGLTMTPKGAYAAVDLDIEVPDEGRYDADMFARQPYMKSGIKIDKDFHGMRGGQGVNNYYVAGSALAGADSLREDSGAGVAILSAIYISNKIAE